MKKKIEGLFSSEALEVSSSDEDSFKLITIYLNEGDHNPIYMKNEDAPTIALAILEAAGYVERTDCDSNDCDNDFGWAMFNLRKGIEAQAKATAETKDREQLEAEALALENTRREVLGTGRFESFEALHPSTKAVSLAVATKARELAKEATK